MSPASGSGRAWRGRSRIKGPGAWGRPRIFENAAGVSPLPAARLPARYMGSFVDFRERRRPASAQLVFVSHDRGALQGAVQTAVIVKYNKKTMPVTRGVGTPLPWLESVREKNIGALGLWDRLRSCETHHGRLMDFA